MPGPHYSSSSGVGGGGDGGSDMLLDPGEPALAGAAPHLRSLYGARVVALLRVALACEGLSGRALRKLPLQAHALCIRSAHRGAEAFCAALLEAVRGERGRGTRWRGRAQTAAAPLSPAR